MFHYVDSLATGAGDGTSWADAFVDLQDALDTVEAGDEVWVAAGVCVPDRGTGDREATFQLLDGVTVAGGYRGLAGGGDPDDRDIDLFESVLNGDLNGDDGTGPFTKNDNSFHVTTCSGTTASAVLDGFTVRGGNANGPWEGALNYGGGMYNNAGSPTVANCTFTGNRASRGGGMCNDQGANATVITCTFTENWASFGAGMYNEDSGPTVTDCTFADNSFQWDGGGVCNGWFHQGDSGPTLTNCTFSNNWGGPGSSGAGISDYGNSTCMLTVINCLFTGNSASYGGAVMMVGGAATLGRCTFVNNSAVGGGGFGDDGGAVWLCGGVADLADCTFRANTAAVGGGGIHIVDSASATLANCVFVDNSADSHGGGMSATGNSPSTLTNCVFTGNWAGWYGGGMANGYSSQATLANCTFSDNSADFLGGGIYSESDSDPTLTNCILWGNIAAPVKGGSVAGSSMGETRWSESDQIDGCSPVITYTCIEGCTTFCQDPQDHNIGDDPLFESDRVHIQPESPCINAGCPYLDYTGQTDIDGQARELLGCVDIGADEVGRTITEGLEVSGEPL